MRELQDIARLLREDPGPFALATLCRVEGASYRRPGARLLLDGSGPRRGSLTGGCLEGELTGAARDVMATGLPRLIRYDLRGEADLVWGSGSGCEGVLHILVEPVRGFPEWLTWVETAQSERKLLHLAIRLEEPGLGVRWPVADGGEPPGTFLESFPPPVALWVVGAGEDTRPLARLAKELGWFLGIADHRAALATPTRFPEADTVATGPPTQWMPKVAFDARTAVVVMTHHYARDLEALSRLAASGPGYVGLMGNRTRTARLVAELATEGGAPPLVLHAPVGLDLGADSPETIALAIIAEIQAVMAGRPGGFLKDLAPGRRA